MRSRDLSVAFVTVIVLAAVWAAASEAAQVARAPARAVKAADCRRCHVAQFPLPREHPDVAVATIAECAGCHTSAPGASAPNLFALRLHRAHGRARLDCATCHAREAGSPSPAPSLGTLDAAQAAMVRTAMQTWAASPWLAATHGRRHDLSCSACHRSQLIPDDNETVVNEQCVACHGGYDALAPLTKTKLANPNINPHASHLGPEIACTVCHHGHRASAPYCLQCHTNFRMPIPGGAKPAAASR